MVTATPTARQNEIYQFIEECIRGDGFPPTLREIGKQFGIKSTNGVAGHLRALEQKGLITRVANRSRAIRLTKQAPYSIEFGGEVC